MKYMIVLIFLLMLLYFMPSSVNAVSLQLTLDRDYNAAARCGSCDNTKTVQTTMIKVTDGVCFLRRTEFEQLNSDEDKGVCEIEQVGSNWVLFAKAKSDADAICNAYCLKWSDQNLFAVHTKYLRETRAEGIECSSGNCNIQNSYCGFYNIELNDIDAPQDDKTWCDLSVDGNGDWILHRRTEGDDAFAGCGALCIEVVQNAQQFNFTVSPENETYAQRSNRVDTKVMRGISANSFCTLTKVWMKNLRDDGDKAICGVYKDAQNWVLKSESIEGDDKEAVAVCQGNCLTWLNTEIQVCGNGQLEDFGPTPEECDDGPNNGPAGNCSLSCTRNFCKDSQIRIGTCGSDFKPGELCKNFGDNVNPEPAFVPNCNAQNGVPACSCGEGKSCSLGAVSMEKDSPAYLAYVPLETGFEDNDTLPSVQDGGVGVAERTSETAWSGAYSYKVTKFRGTGTVNLVFSVTVQSNEEYVAEAFVKTQNNRPNESVRMYGTAGESAFARTTNLLARGYDRLSYRFIPGSSNYELTIEVNKQGVFYIDDVSIKKLDNICQPECTITDASISDRDNADKGTSVTANVWFTGACTAPFYLQIDAVSADETCKIEHLDPGSPGFMQGIDIYCDESDLTSDRGGLKCSKTWTVPDVPEACAGKSVDALYAAIWYNGIVQPPFNENHADSFTLFPDRGTLVFTEEPMPPSCNNNVPDNDEQCDNSAGFAPIACSMLNSSWVLGNVTCSDKCRFLTNECRTEEQVQEELCDNDVIDVDKGEECDPGVPVTEQCSDFTYDDVNYYSGGTLGCYPKSSDNFCKFDKSRCTKPAVCPDGIKDSGEDCDGDDFGEVNSCNDVHENFMPAGSLGCNPDCSYDISNCRPDGCTSSPAGTGVCELPFENRQECQDCAAEFSNVRSEQSGGNTRFSGTISGVSGTPWLQEFIACNYAPGFSNLGRCISQYNDNECGFDRTTGQPKDCICNDLTTSCSVQCFDYSGKFYLYAEGIVGPAGETIDFKIRSDKAAFSCEQVGLNDLRSLKDEIDTKTYIAFSNWQYAQQHGLPSAGTWRSVESALSSMQAALKQFFDSYEQGSPVNAAEVQDLIAQANAALQQADELVRSIGG